MTSSPTQPLHGTDVLITGECHNFNISFLWRVVASAIWPCSSVLGWKRSLLGWHRIKAANCQCLHPKIRMLNGIGLLNCTKFATFFWLLIILTGMTAHQAHHHESILSRSIHFDPFRPSGWGWSTKRPQREQILPKGLTLEKTKYAFWIIMNFSFQRPCKDQKSNDSWHSSLHYHPCILQCRHRWQLVQSHDWCCVGLGAEPTNWEARLRECAQFGSPALRGAMQGISFKSFIFPSLNATFCIGLVHLHIIPQETFVPGPELVVSLAHPTQAALAHSLHLLPFLPFVSFQIWLFQVWSNK